MSNIVTSKQKLSCEHKLRHDDDVRVDDDGDDDVERLLMTRRDLVMMWFC